MANAAQVNVETVRFYERKGLIRQPEKPYFGIRRYPAEIVQHIRFLKQAQSLGFTLSEAREMLMLHADDPAACVQARHRAAAKLVAVREKCVALHALELALHEMIATCDRQSPEYQVCPILRAMGSSMVRDTRDSPSASRHAEDTVF